MKATMKVMIVEPAGNLWGSEQVLLETLRSAPYSEWEVAVCCPPATPLIEKLAGLPVQIFPCFIADLHKKGRLQRFAAAARLLWAAITFKPDLIYINQAGATRIAAATARVLRFPMVTHVRLSEDVGYVTRLNADALLLRRIICVSDYILEQFSTLKRANSSRLVTIYDPYTPRSDWGSTGVGLNEPSTFCCVGRLAFGKGQDVVLQALHNLKLSGTSAHVRFLGTAPAGSPFDSDLVEQARQLDISNQITWLGFQEDVLGKTIGCEAQLCPSRQESLGRVVFEAWDAGLVPIAWKGSGGPAEIIAASGGGVLFDRHEGDCLANAMLRVMRMPPEERRQMVEKGRTWLRENCDPDRYAKELFELFNKVVEKGGHRQG